MASTISPDPGYLALESASKLLTQAVEQVRLAHYANPGVGKSALNGANALEDVANAMSVLAQADKWEYDQHDHTLCEHVGGGHHPGAVCECGHRLARHGVFSFARMTNKVCWQEIPYDNPDRLPAQCKCGQFRWKKPAPLSPGAAHTGQG